MNLQALVKLFGIGLTAFGIGISRSANYNREAQTSGVYRIAQEQADYAANVQTRLTEAFLYLESNGLPTHNTGQFPNRHNPHAIVPQVYAFRIARQPSFRGEALYSKSHLFGVALNGVVFDPGTAEFWNGDRNWRYEALSGRINLGLDSSHAHVQPNGAYHYHGSPDNLVAQIGDASQPLLVGYAADGFPIYNAVHPDTLAPLKSSYRMRSGQRSGGPGGEFDGTFVQDYEYAAGLGDLDECNGRWGKTTEFPGGTYYYAVTKAYPFVPRCFMGTPDDSFAVKRFGPSRRRKSGAPLLDKDSPAGWRPPPRRRRGRPPRPPIRF
ncbi:MAG: YHYH protein [Cyanobacteria bacterium P01_F01_bin.42]